MTIDTITLPAAWASALVNGDFSGLTGFEAGRCDEAIATLAHDGWVVVSCKGEPRFTSHYDLYDPDSGFLGGDVLDYLIAR